MLPAKSIPDDFVMMKNVAGIREEEKLQKQRTATGFLFRTESEPRFTQSGSDADRNKVNGHGFTDASREASSLLSPRRPTIPRLCPLILALVVVRTI